MSSGSVCFFLFQEGGVRIDNTAGMSTSNKTPTMSSIDRTTSSSALPDYLLERLRFCFPHPPAASVSRGL